jgi:hypothetical protein
MEIWKTIAPIKKKDGSIFTPYGYEISNMGRVRTKRQRYGRPRKDLGEQRKPLENYVFINGRKDPAGYMQLCLYDENKKRSNVRIHVAVMQTFVGYPEKDQVVCHYDDIKSNNQLTNLRYDTQKSNSADKKRNSAIDFAKN